MERRGSTAARILTLAGLSAALAALTLSSGCTSNPGTTSATPHTAPSVPPEIAQSDAMKLETSVSVVFKQSDFYSLISPNAGNCAGDAKTYYKALDAQYPTSAVTGETGSTGARVPYDVSAIDPSTTIHPSFIKNISVDITDANYVPAATGSVLAGSYPAAFATPGPVNAAYACSYGSGGGAAPPSNCATFDTYTTAVVGGAGTWSTILDSQLVSGNDSEGSGAVSDSKGNLYFTGDGKDSGGKYEVIVFSSTDSGNSWLSPPYSFLYNSGGTTYDTYSYRTETGLIAVTPSDQVFVGGEAIVSGSVFPWTIVENSGVGSFVGYGTNCTGGCKVAFPNSSSTSTDFSRIISDPTGRLYIAGDLTSGTTTTWNVQKSTDGGATWSSVAPPVYSSSTDTRIYSITTDTSGNLYAVGYASISGTKHWIFMKSTDQGATWTTPSPEPSGSGDYLYASGTDTIANAVGVNAAGTIFVAGTASASGGLWLIRKSTDGGSTWSTTSYQLASGQVATPAAIGFDASGDPFVVGQANDLAGSTHWIVLDSIDNGLTWNKVDDYQLISGKAASAIGITRDSFGNMYVVGYGYDATTPTSVSHFIVRKSSSSSGGGYYQPTGNYQAGYYTLFDDACTGQGPILSSDPNISKLEAGGVYFDLDRTQLQPNENLLLNLTYIPLGPSNRKPNGSYYGTSESTYFKIHLVKTGQTLASLQDMIQPRHLVYADTTGFPEVGQSISVMAQPTGQIRQDQIFIPLAASPTADRIRVERYSGSAILIDASLFRMSQGQPAATTGQ